MRPVGLFQTDVLLSPHEEMHSHQGGELLMVLEGTLLVESAEKLRLRESELIYINGGEQHAIHSAEKDTLIFRCSFSSKVLRPGHYYACSSRDAGDARAFRELRSVIYEILADYYSEDVGDPLYLRQSLCYRLLHLLDAYFRISLDQADGESRIKVICSYIEQNYTEELSLQTLADLFHFTPTYLSRMFKSCMGENLVPYLSQVRLRHAVEELVSTDDTVTQIALNNGFSSAGSFYTFFRRIYGQKPLEYRNAHRIPAQTSPKDTTAEAREKLGEHLKFFPAEKKSTPDQVRTIRADIRRGTPVTQNFLRLVNVGSAENFRLKAVQQTLSKERRVLGYQYARFWNVFPTEVYEGNPWTDFSLMNDIIDILQDNFLIPYIQVGGERPVEFSDRFDRPSGQRVFRTPQYLLSACRQLFDYLANALPLDAPVLIELRGSFSEEGEPSRENYAAVFLELREMLRQRLPQARLGGPGWPMRFCTEKNAVSQWELKKIRPDFFAFAAFPYHGVPGGVRIVSDPDWLSQDMSLLKAMLNKQGLGEIPVFLTEWNAFLSAHNYFHDSVWKAGFSAKIYNDTLGSVDLIAHQLLMDETPRDGQNRPIISGGRGLLTVNGIPKPAYHAIRCIRNLGNYILAREEGCVVTSAGHHAVRALIYNYKHLNYKIYQKEAEDPDPRALRQYLLDLTPQTFRLELAGMKEGSYRIQVFSISEAHGSILDEWIRKGMIPLRNRNKLLLSSAIDPDVRIYFAETQNGVLSLSFTLEPMELLGVDISIDWS